MSDLFIQARMASTRLSKKVLLPIGTMPMLQHVIQRAQKSRCHRVIVLTTTNREDDVIVHFCNKMGVDCYRGPNENVLQRFVLAGMQYNSKTIVRITADCPFIDPEIINTTLDAFEKNEVDYASTDQIKDLPRGLDVEVFSIDALKKVQTLCQDPKLLEHVTLFMKKNPDLFRLHFVDFRKKLAHLRLCVDTKLDYEMVCAIFEKLGKQDPCFSADAIFALLQKEPQLAMMGGTVEQK